MGRPRTSRRRGDRVLGAGVSLGVHAGLLLAFASFARVMPGLAEPPAMEAALFQASTSSPEPAPTTAPASERRQTPAARQIQTAAPIRPRLAVATAPDPLVPATTPTPQTVQALAAPTAVPVGAQASAAAPAQAGGGAPVRARGEASRSHDPYAAQVLSWIEARKSMPEGLRRRRSQGVVVVAFTLDRFGRLSRPVIIESSGDSALDDAAMDLLSAAAPFPKAPRDADWSRRRFETPIAYAVRG